MLFDSNLLIINKIFKNHKLLNIYGSTEVTADATCFDTSKWLVKNKEIINSVPKLFSPLSELDTFYQQMIEDVFEEKIIEKKGTTNYLDSDIPIQSYAQVYPLVTIARIFTASLLILLLT